MLFCTGSYLNQRIALSEANVDYARRTLELAQVRRAAGAAMALEVLDHLVQSFGRGAAGGIIGFAQGAFSENTY